MDGVLTEQHRHRIVDTSGRNVPARVHALQSLNQSLFKCVDNCRRLASARLDDSGHLPFAHDPANKNTLGSIRMQRHGTHRQRPAPRRHFRHQPAAFDECAAHRPRRSCRLVEPPRTQEHSAGRGLRIHDAVGKSNFGLLYDTCHGSDGTTSTPVICRGRPDPD